MRSVSDDGKDAPDCASEPLRVLLISPVRSRDPFNGDVTTTEHLLAHPPDGVVYTPYDEALSSGSLVEYHRRGALAPGLSGRALFIRETLINRARARSWLFREPFRHFRVDPGRFDVVHVHVFSVGFHGDAPPTCFGSSIDIGAVYRDGFMESARSVRRREYADRWLARRTGVTHASFPTPREERVALSENWRTSLIARGASPNHVAVIPPGVEVPATPRLRESGTFVVGYIGHWEAKGGPAVLRAYERMHAGGIDCRLVVVGSEPQLSRREQERLNVQWLPRLDRRVLLEEVAPTFSVFAYPSKFDGLPLTLLEMMSLGIPAIVSDFRALPEVVDYGRAGAFVARDDDTALERELRRLLDPDVCREVGQAGRARVAAHYSAEVVAAAHGRLYHSLAGSNRNYAK